MKRLALLTGMFVVGGCCATETSPDAQGASSPYPLTLASVTRTCPGLTEEEASIIQVNLDNAMSVSGVSYEGALEGASRVCEHFTKPDSCAACIIALGDEVYDR